MSKIIPKKIVLLNQAILHSMLEKKNVTKTKFNYSSTSKILAFTLLFPPVGSASALPHTKQSTFVAVFPKVICSFLHLGHLILMNLLVGSFIFTILAPLTSCK